MLDAETSWEELICSSLRAGETIYVDDEHLKNRVVKIAEKIGEKAYVKVLTPELKDKGLKRGAKPKSKFKSFSIK